MFPTRRQVACSQSEEIINALNLNKQIMLPGKSADTLNGVPNGMTCYKDSELSQRVLLEAEEEMERAAEYKRLFGDVADDAARPLSLIQGSTSLVQRCCIPISCARPLRLAKHRTTDFIMFASL